MVSWPSVSIGLICLLRWLYSVIMAKPCHGWLVGYHCLVSLWPGHVSHPPPSTAHPPHSYLWQHMSLTAYQGGQYCSSCLISTPSPTASPPHCQLRVPHCQPPPHPQRYFSLWPPILPIFILVPWSAYSPLLQRYLSLTQATGSPHLQCCGTHSVSPPHPLPVEASGHLVGAQ